MADRHGRVARQGDVDRVLAQPRAELVRLEPRGALARSAPRASAWSRCLLAELGRARRAPASRSSAGSASAPPCGPGSGPAAPRAPGSSSAASIAVLASAASSSRRRSAALGSDVPAQLIGARQSMDGRSRTDRGSRPSRRSATRRLRPQRDVADLVAPRDVSPAVRRAPSPRQKTQRPDECDLAQRLARTRRKRDRPRRPVSAARSSSNDARTTGCPKIAPMLARTAFGPNGSAVSGLSTTAPASSASAARSTAPTFPGRPRRAGRRLASRRRHPSTARSRCSQTPITREPEPSEPRPPQHVAPDRDDSTSPGRPPSSARRQSSCVRVEEDRRRLRRPGASASASMSSPSARNSPDRSRCLRSWSFRSSLSLSLLCCS